MEKKLRTKKEERDQETQTSKKRKKKQNLKVNFFLCSCIMYHVL